jgi:hypothetical protein
LLEKLAPCNRRKVSIAQRVKVWRRQNEDKLQGKMGRLRMHK